MQSFDVNHSVAYTAFWISSSLFLIKDLRASDSTLGKLFSINLVLSLYDENEESLNLASIQSKSELEIPNESMALYNNSNVLRRYSKV